jgi:hypothetical protein
MPVYLTDKNTINNNAASLARTVDGAFLRVQLFKAWLDTQVDANLISAYGYVQGDLDIIRSSFVDLELLRTVYQGTATQGTLKDFRSFAKQLYPFGSI